MYVLIFIGLLLFDILKFHINISIYTPFFLTEKDLSLETLDSPQFSLVYHATLKFLICTYLLFFGFWITVYQCCLASHKWTPEPTMNEKSHDCSVMLQKKQASYQTFELYKTGFPTATIQKHVYTLGQYCSSR